MLKDYNSLNEVTFENIVDFHSKFEKIHPFQDGNGKELDVLFYLKNV